MTTTPARTARAPRPAPAPVAGPLPPARNLPARRSRPALWLAGLLAVIVCGLAAAALVRSVGTTHPYLAVTRQVAIGEKIADGDLTVVEINAAAGLNPIGASERSSIVGSYAKVTLTPGTLLVRDQLTTQQVPGAGRHLVSISLKPELQPARPLAPGDRLLLVATEDPRTVQEKNGPQPLAPPPTFDAIVHKVGKPTTAGDVVVDVTVSDKDGPTVAALAAAGRIVPVVTAGR
ncbi:MAG: hypothetical protein V7603_5082 [Micromonosporaceae bacterium]